MCPEGGQSQHAVDANEAQMQTTKRVDGRAKRGTHRISFVLFAGVGMLHWLLQLVVVVLGLDLGHGLPAAVCVAVSISLLKSMQMDGWRVGVVYKVIGPGFVCPLAKHARKMAGLIKLLCVPGLLEDG